MRRYTVEGEDLFTTLNPIICRTTLIGGVGVIEGMKRKCNSCGDIKEVTAHVFCNFCADLKGVVE